MGIPLIQQYRIGKYLLQRKLRGDKRYPLVLMLEPLFQCNLACSGCGKIDYPKEILQKRMSVADALKAVDECDAPVVSIPGGEPLIHRELPQIVGGIIARKKFVYLCTNAILVPKHIDEYRPSPYLTFSIHLDGNEHKHDQSVCQEGVFDKAVAAIKLLRERGFRVTVNCTIFTGEDPKEIAEFFDFAMGLGVEGITASPGFQYTHAPRQDVFLGRTEGKRLFREIFAQRAGAKRAWAFNHSALFLDFLAGNQSYQCTPWSNPTYNIFGWQKPCYLMADEGYASSFRELMEDTEWSRYGVGRDPRCDNCMAHCGYEGTAVDDMLRHPLKALRIALRGPTLSGPMAPEPPVTYGPGARLRTSVVPVSAIGRERSARRRRPALTSLSLGSPEAAARGAARLDNGFAQQLTRWQQRMEHALAARLPSANSLPERLHAGMRYAVLGAGKRVRPILVFASAQAVGLSEDEVEGAACAIELIHAYSLVHDDLPAMDDDDMRRGRPTCHKAFDEATAILVGDALQPLAFEVLAHDPALPAQAGVRLALIGLLAQASGSAGMAGGQGLDLAAEGRRLELAGIELLHARKTGALIRASVMMAAECQPSLPAQLKASLNTFATASGLAFQIQDDLLDLEGDAGFVADDVHARPEKPSYPAVAGVAAARERALELHQRAIGALEPFGARADTLRYLSNWLLTRQS